MKFRLFLFPLVLLAITIGGCASSAETTTASTGKKEIMPAGVIGTLKQQTLICAEITQDGKKFQDRALVRRGEGFCIVQGPSRITVRGGAYIAQSPFPSQIQGINRMMLIPKRGTVIESAPISIRLLDSNKKVLSDCGPMQFTGFEPNAAKSTINLNYAHPQCQAVLRIFLLISGIGPSQGGTEAGFLIQEAELGRHQKSVP